MDKQTALVVLSGGQDSTICLFMALNDPRFSSVSAITFDYGQRHSIELEAASEVWRTANAIYGSKMGEHHFSVVPAGLLRGTSPLTNPKFEVEKYESAAVLPGGLEKTFVPGRNMLFLTLAANLAYCEGHSHIYTGVSQQDYGGYPDCRSLFIAYMQSAICSGLDRQIKIETPLIDISKAASVACAQKLHGCLDALAYSHTCYEGCLLSPVDGTTLVPCGKCHACLLRAESFRKAKVPDPLIARLTREGAL